MKIPTLITISALLLGAAHAQSAPAAAPTPLSTQTKLPQALNNQTQLLQSLYTDGGKIELVNKDGAVVGSLTKDGQYQLTGTTTLSDVTSVKVLSPTGETRTYILGRDLSKPGMVKIEWTQKNGKVASLPLSALLHRQADSKPADKIETTKPETAQPQGKPAQDKDANDDDAPQPEKPEKPQKPEKPEKPVKPEKPKKP